MNGNYSTGYKDPNFNAMHKETLAAYTAEIRISDTVNSKVADGASNNWGDCPELSAIDRGTRFLLRFGVEYRVQST